MRLQLKALFEQRLNHEVSGIGPAGIAKGSGLRCLSGIFHYSRSFAIPLIFAEPGRSTDQLKAPNPERIGDHQSQWHSNGDISAAWRAADITVGGHTRLHRYHFKCRFFL